jgi:hypothetical protein
MARPCGYHGGSTEVAALQQVLGQGDTGLVYVIESFLVRIATVVNGKPVVSA